VVNRLPFRALLLLLLALPAARAGEGDPRVFFRDPDPKTKRRIEDLASRIDRLDVASEGGKEDRVLA